MHKCRMERFVIHYTKAGNICKICNCTEEYVQHCTSRRKDHQWYNVELTYLNNIFKQEELEIK